MILGGFPNCYFVRSSSVGLKFKNWILESEAGYFELILALILNRPSLTIRNLMIVESGEWPWPFIKMEKFKSANGQIQKLAIPLSWPFVGPDRVWSVHSVHFEFLNYYNFDKNSLERSLLYDEHCWLIKNVILFSNASSSILVRVPWSCGGTWLVCTIWNR